MAQIAPPLKPDFKSRPPPPTAFSHMPRDDLTAHAVKTGMEQLESSFGITMVEWTLEPIPLHARFFSDRIANVTVEQSAAIFSALKEGGQLDAAGMLKFQPRSGVWKMSIRADPAASAVIKALGDTLVADASPVAEEMNVAFAHHEISADHMPKVFEWLREVAPGTSPTWNDAVSSLWHG